jgi:hypothetical protein
MIPGINASLLDLKIWSSQKFSTSRSVPLWPLARKELNPLASCASLLFSKKSVEKSILDLQW